MSKSTKIWLLFAIVLSAATTVLNASFGRWVSVVIAIGAIVGLFILLFQQKKLGFYLNVGFYVAAFLNGVLQNTSGETGLFVSVIMSLVGSLLVPGITYLFLRRDWANLK